MNKEESVWICSVSARVSPTKCSSCTLLCHPPVLHPHFLQRIVNQYWILIWAYLLISLGLFRIKCLSWLLLMMKAWFKNVVRWIKHLWGQSPPPASLMERFGLSWTLRIRWVIYRGGNVERRPEAALALLLGWLQGIRFKCWGSWRPRLNPDDGGQSHPWVEKADQEGPRCHSQ